MKSVAGKGKKNAPQKNQVNLRDVTEKIITTMLLLERPHGTDYIARLLTGGSIQYLTSTDHMKIETVGSVKDFTNMELRYIMLYLMQQGYLERVNDEYTRVQLTAFGEQAAGQVKDIWISSDQYRLTTERYFLHNRMRDYRTQASAHHEVAPYVIFNNMMLDMLARQAPRTLKKLQTIGGMNPRRMANYGTEMIKAIQNALRDYDHIRQSKRNEKLVKPTHQRVLRLHREGNSCMEIATILGIKDTTAWAYLMNFHEAKVIDLTPTIEAYMDPKDLTRAREFFRIFPETELVAAMKELDLPYQECRMAKIIIAESQGAPVAA